MKVGTTSLRTLWFDELPAEAAFDAKVAVRDVVIQRRCDFDDLAVLGMHGQRASHPAIAADGIGLGLPAK